jgi:hypothetical protein
MRINSVCLVVFFFVLVVQSCTSDSTKKLGNGYFYRNEGEAIKDILSKNPDGAEIPSTILSYAYDERIIIAKQKPKLPQDPLYKKKYQYKNNKNEIYYWIIIKEENIDYGPLNRGEYQELRTKLNVPVNLQLK